MEKKEFATAALDPEYKTFVVYIAFFSFTPLVASLGSNPLNADIHFFRRPQISGLITKETPTKVLSKYLEFADVFSLDLASKLSEYTGINNYTIELVNGQQPLYRPIYSLGPVELETLKAYIETNLVNKFIRSFKSSVSTPILFDWKSNSFFRLCVNY